MSGYIGKLQIGNNIADRVAFGDVLYGTCNTAAATANKEATVTDVTATIDGLYVRIKFISGNTVESNVNLKVGNLTSYPVLGDCTCGAGEVVGFTFEEVSTETKYWRAVSGGVSQAVRNAITNATSNILSAAHGMVFKGTIGAGGTIDTTASPAQNLPLTGYHAGWTYRVITSGTYASQECEVGDLIIAIADAPSIGNGTNADWTVAQGNIDGAVIGPANQTTNNTIALWDGTTGRILKI